jgi:hypothetical protein
MGVVNRLDQETKGSLKFLDDGLDERGEAQVGVLGVDVLCELGDGLCVGLRLELEALALEQRLELLVVCDDTVVDDGELPVGVGPDYGESAWRFFYYYSFGDNVIGSDIPVGVAVDTRWGTVGSPSSVSNTGVRVEDLVEVEVLLLNKLLQGSHLADLLDSEDLILLVTVDGETSRVVATVF